MTLPSAHSARSPGRSRRMRARTTIAVEVLVCGSADRGDDGAAIVATRELKGRLDPDVRLRVVGQLDIDDLLAIAPGAAVVIVDTATGIRPGHIVELSLDGLVDRGDGVRPRSSHSLEFREVIGLANMLRGHPLRGRIVAIGGHKFDLGAPLSPSVARALPQLNGAILDVVRRLRA